VQILQTGCVQHRQQRVGLYAAAGAAAAAAAEVHGFRVCEQQAAAVVCNHQFGCVVSVSQVMVPVWARGARSQASYWTTMHGAGGEFTVLYSMTLSLASPTCNDDEQEVSWGCCRSRCQPYLTWQPMNTLSAAAISICQQLSRSCVGTIEPDVSVLPVVLQASSVAEHQYRPSCGCYT
jgi:hypothetical protein